MIPFARHTPHHTPVLSRSDEGSASELLVFAASFAAFFVFALVAKLLTWRWRPWLPGSEGERSMVSGVKAAVYSFMSHLP